MLRQFITQVIKPRYLSIYVSKPPPLETKPDENQDKDDDYIIYIHDDIQPHVIIDIDDKNH